LPYCHVACPRENGTWPCAWMTAEDFANGIECLNASDCCVIAECPSERVFPDCASEPFIFRSATRELAYWLRVLTPKWNCILIHSDFFLFSWLRSLPGMAAKVDFPGDECAQPTFNDNDLRWRHCARQNILLLSPWIILFVLAYMLLWGFVALFIVSFVGILKLTSAFARTMASVARATFSKISPRPAKMTLIEGAVIGHTRTRQNIKKD